MKLTLSYVRGLRDVLDISSREDRREYIKERERNTILGVVGSGLASILIIGIATYMELPAIQYAIASFTSLSIMGGVFYYGTREKTINGARHHPISNIARHQQDHIKVRNRNQNNFPQSKLALDNF